MQILQINRETIEIKCNCKEEAELLKGDIDTTKLYNNNKTYDYRQHRVYIIKY